MTGVQDGIVAFGDIDNDGDLDLALVGKDINSNDHAEVYLNNKTSLTYSLVWSNELTPTNLASLSFGDFDNDGKIDLIEMGIGDYLKLYRNNGTALILNQSSGPSGIFGGVYEGSFGWGDYDNDGDLDLVATGYEQGTNYIYKNNNSLFIKDNIAGLGVHASDLHQDALAWGDLDNDGDLDLVTIGINNTYLQALLYTNNATINNTLPKHPNSTDFSASYANNQLTLSWGNGSDNETPINGLYYNLRVGTTSGGNQIVSGVYGGGEDNGYFGNMMQRKSIALHGSWLQPSTTYYWSVQTIDTGLAKSNWSVEQTFSTAADITYPSITINYPADSNYTSFSNITFSANISDNVAVSNVSLYGSWINWHRNQTDSSGLNGTEYLFQINLSAYNEGTFTWAIRACDTTNNCIFSANRTVKRDLSYPLVYLESPANSSSWTANNSVTFSFNVTDLGIANCSLIVSSSRKYNFISVTVNTSTSATVTLSNGNYEWNVSCTDMLNRTNSSSTYQLTVNYQAPSTPSTSGGGGGGGLAYSTYSVGELKEAQEVNKALGKGDKIKFNLTAEQHILEVKKITSENATIEINSTAFNFTLAINESKKLNLASAEFYDLIVKLNNIKLFKANLTIMAIHEAIYVKPVEKEKPAANVTGIEEEKHIETEKEKKILSEKKFYQILVFSLIFIIIVCLLAHLVLKKKKRKE